MQYSFIWSVARPICFQFQVVEDWRGEITLNEMSIDKINASNGARYMTPHVSEQIWPRRTERKLRMTLVISFGYCHGDKRHACPWSCHLATLNRNGENNISLSARWGVSFVFFTTQRPKSGRTSNRLTLLYFFWFQRWENRGIWISFSWFVRRWFRATASTRNKKSPTHLLVVGRSLQTLFYSDDPTGWLCIGFSVSKLRRSSHKRFWHSMLSLSQYTGNVNNCHVHFVSNVINSRWLKAHRSDISLCLSAKDTRNCDWICNQH